MFKKQAYLFYELLSFFAIKTIRIFKLYFI